MTWRQWIRQKWPVLIQGEKLEAPNWLGHPKHNGFEQLKTAMPKGQHADWGLACSDGSRIHVQEFSGGRLLVHRDKFDPERRIDYTLAHLVAETPFGLLALLGIFTATCEN